MVKQGSTKLIVSTALNELRKYAEKQHAGNFPSAFMIQPAESVSTVDKTSRIVDSEVERSLFGSRRLRRAKDALDSDPASGDEIDKILGSRRIGKASKAFSAQPIPKPLIEAEPLPLVKSSIEINAPVDQCFDAASRLADYPKLSLIHI
eukprot:3466368-Rhodomonas_salina.1